jgi:hypothetical protein
MSVRERAGLDRELAYYAQHKQEWLVRESGKYVVIKENSVLGFYRNFEAAYRAGATTYGIDTDFLVKQIVEQEPVFFLF